jgi:ABC-2 type transport system permease protein
MESRQKRISQVFMNEFKILRNDKKTLASFILGPIIILGLIGAVTTMTGGTGLAAFERMKAAVVDEDNSRFSHALVSRFQQSDQITVKYTTTDRASAMLMFEKGEVDVIYIIENGFDNKLRTYYLSGGSQGKATMDIIVDTSWVTPPSAALAVGNAVLLDFFQRDAIPIILNLPQGQQVPPEQLQQLIAKLSPINTPLQAPYGENQLFAILLPTVVPLMLVSFSLQLSGLAIVGERMTGTLSRILKTPIRKSEIVIGKALAYTGLAIVQTLGVVAVSLLFGLSAKSGVIPYFIGLFLTSYSACALGILFSSFSTSDKAVIQIGNTVALLLNALGGAIIPLSSMAPPLQAAGELLPVYNSVTALRDIVLKGLGPDAWLPYMAYLALFGTLTLVVAVVVFRFTKIE